MEFKKELEALRNQSDNLTEQIRNVRTDWRDQTAKALRELLPAIPENSFVEPYLTSFDIRDEEYSLWLSVYEEIVHDGSNRLEVRNIPQTWPSLGVVLSILTLPAFTDGSVVAFLAERRKAFQDQMSPLLEESKEVDSKIEAILARRAEENVAAILTKLIAGDVISFSVPMLKDLRIGYAEYLTNVGEIKMLHRTKSGKEYTLEVLHAGKRRYNKYYHDELARTTVKVSAKYLQDLLVAEFGMIG